MRLQKLVLRLATFAFLTATLGSRAETLVRREWEVNGAVREALIYIPPSAKSNSTPVIFAFHGHGGTMRNAARTFHFESEWPESIVVYMQGLNTPGRLTDPEGKRPGWQSAVGAQDDRDLKFFDAVLSSLKKDYRVDGKRIYASGHSNGGSFTYLLWAARGELFAAMAPSASAAPGMLTQFKPKPVMHLGAENDPLVKFEWQKFTIDAVRKINQCSDGKTSALCGQCTVYESKVGAPVITYIHEGKHGFPQEASAVIVKFFKQHAMK